MKLLSMEDYEEIRRWIYRNARPLDLALWQYHFEKGSKEEVLKHLLFYQNSDGGFGNIIEPDNWNPASSPYNAHFVIRILQQIDYKDISHPIYQGLFRYLEQTEYQAEYGWFFLIPSNEAYPHAIWWDYNEQANESQSIGITAQLSGFLLRYGDPGSKLYHMADRYCRRLLDRLPVTENFGDMGVQGCLRLLEELEAAGLADRYGLTSVRGKILDLVRRKIEQEKDNFMASPLEFIDSPGSSLYEEYKEEVEEELDRIIDSRPSSGVWELPWEWYQGDRYVKEFAISANWWKSFEAIGKLLKLESFGRFRR